jgi:hypothetical protein
VCRASWAESYLWQAFEVLPESRLNKEKPLYEAAGTRE